MNGGFPAGLPTPARPAVEPATPAPGAPMPIIGGIEIVT